MPDGFGGRHLASAAVLLDFASNSGYHGLGLIRALHVVLKRVLGRYTRNFNFASIMAMKLHEVVGIVRHYPWVTRLGLFPDTVNILSVCSIETVIDAFVFDPIPAVMGCWRFAEWLWVVLATSLCVYLSNSFHEREVYTITTAELVDREFLWLLFFSEDGIGYRSIRELKPNLITNFILFIRSAPFELHHDVNMRETTLLKFQSRKCDAGLVEKFANLQLLS